MSNTHRTMIPGITYDLETPNTALKRHINHLEDRVARLEEQLTIRIKQLDNVEKRLGNAVEWLRILEQHAPQEVRDARYKKIAEQVLAKLGENAEEPLEC